jgi:hypothetical protein
MKIHISESTKEQLNATLFEVIERGKLDINGNQTIRTYFVS